MAKDDPIFSIGLPSLFDSEDTPFPQPVVPVAGVAPAFQWTLSLGGGGGDGGGGDADGASDSDSGSDSGSDGGSDGGGDGGGGGGGEGGGEGGA